MELLLLMVSSGCTVVEHSSLHLEVGGSSPATATSPGRSCTVVEHSPHHLEVGGSRPDMVTGSGRKKTTTSVVAQWLSTDLIILR